jgi:sensor histidine kinase regulating citrate/malate metabolism
MVGEPNTSNRRLCERLRRCNLRHKWSNKIKVVDSFLKLHRLEEAKDFAQSLLQDEENLLMFTDYEIEYLKLVICIKKIDDITNGHGELI